VYEISSDGMNLTVYSADVDDTARYTCIAENIGGEVEKSFDLNVHGSTVIFTLYITFPNQNLELCSFPKNLS
jgi:hypothetical protein